MRRKTRTTKTKKRSTKKVVPPPPLANIEAAIHQCAEGFRKLTESDLTEDALVLLIQHACTARRRPAPNARSYGKPTRKDILAIIDAGAHLDELYLKSLQEDV